jgi:hypothetical protein
MHHTPLADKQTPGYENPSPQEEDADELDCLTPSKQQQRRDNPTSISPRSSSSSSPSIPLDPALGNLSRPSGALVTKSVPLHHSRKKHRQDDSDSDEHVAKKPKSKWNPHNNDPEHVEEWYKVANLLQRWYIDNGPVAMGQGGDEEIRMEMWNRYTYVFGDDAPPLVDEKWDRARWVSSTCELSKCSWRVSLGNSPINVAFSLSITTACFITTFQTVEVLASHR